MIEMANNPALPKLAVYFRDFVLILALVGKGLIELRVSAPRGCLGLAARRHIGKFAPLFVMIGMFAALARMAAPSDIRNPGDYDSDGVSFTVDGQNYQHSMAGLWPVGSPHQLWVSQGLQGTLAPKTQFVFMGWSTPQGSIAGNPISIIASPYTTQYTAYFDTQYLVSIRFLTCGQPGSCAGNGDVTSSAIGVVSSDQDVYVSTQNPVQFTAVAHPGYAFAGWQAGPHQLIQGPIDTLTLTGPMTVYPKFVPARNITVASAPQTFQLLIDHAPITPPWTFSWGWDTVHTWMWFPRRRTSGATPGYSIRGATAAPRNMPIPWANCRTPPRLQPHLFPPPASASRLRRRV